MFPEKSNIQVFCQSYKTATSAIKAKFWFTCPAILQTVARDRSMVLELDGTGSSNARTIA